MTPEEFAELFPKYYLKKMPDVKGFYDALSKKKESKLGGEDTSKSSGAADVTSREKVTNTVKAKEIYDYIRSKGVDHNHAVGIINNMKYESNFNSGAEHVDNNGLMSGGLFQHNGTRYRAMVNYVGPDWKTNWKKQIDFAMTEGDMKSYLAINYPNARESSIGFTEVFERPYQTKTTAMYRSHTAGGYEAAVMGKAGEPGGGSTTGGNFETTPTGYVVPKNKGLYDAKNEEQCATLAKGINPDLGRTSGWTVVEGPIRPGVVVATTRYNLPGGDRMGAGYHAGVAMTAPDEAGNFLLLEQFKGQRPRLRSVNRDEYDGGAMGGKVKFGLVQSNGRLHDEQSREALQMGANLADEEQKKRILSNLNAIENGGYQSSTGTGTGSVDVKRDETSQAGPQNTFEQQQAYNAASTAQISDVVKIHSGQIGTIMNMINMITSVGEGIGDGKKSRRRNPANAPADPSLDHTKRAAIEREAKNLGVDPFHLAAAMFYESIGSLNPNRMGVVDKRKGSASAQKAGAQKRYMGLIQMGSAEQQKYGVKKGQTFDEHMSSVGKFLKDRNLGKWMQDHPHATEEEKRTALYSTINAGHPDEKHWNKTDKKAGGSATTVRQKSEQMVQRYGERAKMLLASEAPDQAQVENRPEVKPQEQSMTARIAKSAKDFLGYDPYKPTAAADTKPATDPSSTTEVFNRMRQMKSPTAPVPEVQGSVDYAPSVLNPDYVNQAPIQPATPDRRSMLPEPQQNQVSINPLEMRNSHMQPTASLARAMDNARGVVSSNYTSLTNTQLG